MWFKCRYVMNSKKNAQSDQFENDLMKKESKKKNEQYLHCTVGLRAFTSSFCLETEYIQARKRKKTFYYNKIYTQFILYISAVILVDVNEK